MQSKIGDKKFSFYALTENNADKSESNKSPGVVYLRHLALACTVHEYKSDIPYASTFHKFTAARE
jgi:hypothetical protein